MSDVKLVVSHGNEDVTPDEAIVIYRDIRDGFVCSINDLVLKPQEFKCFIDDINNTLEPLVEYNYSRSKNNVLKRYIGENVRIYAGGNSLDIFCSFYTTSESINKQVWDLYTKNSKEESGVEIFMHSYFMNGNTLENGTKHIKYEELNYISEKYYPYINTEIMFDQFFTGAENILLLVGEPGLGKSKMSTLALKYAYQNSDKLPYDKIKDNPVLENQFISVVYVKSTDVLINDKFWRELSKAQADFCIIDDLDYMLTKRDSEVLSSDDMNKNSFLNQFLSFTDGVEKHKTKFIITTNQRYDDIDAALLRKGRLFDILELRQLDREEAIEIWKDNNLLEDDFKNIFKTHEILPADLGSEINKRLNTRITTATESYLKEEGISKVQRAGRTKKISI